MIILLVVACFLLCTSVCTYGIFYYLYVPPQQFEHPVYFDYASENLDLPVSQIDLLHSMHLKKKSSSKRVLRSGVQYSFTLELIVPDSPRNRNAGVWMIEASLLNGKKMITTSKIPTILTYRSKGIRSVRSVLYGIPIVTGLMKESQHISVDLLSNFREKKKMPTTDITLKISNKKIDIYSAKLIVEANFKGLSLKLFSLIKNRDISDFMLKLPLREYKYKGS
ncbi:seipin [Anaeramoeba flamelloides]|uniref:Seipin n=1 Tax=Anaeramoeba flamelloides TaxID=1746091 RepID=A0ABQ8XNP2_9EUKA|nr:seipin [Anaeramoeba flamelloides]